MIVTTFEEDDYVFGALRRRASGFLLKRTGPEDLIAAIHTVAEGEALLSPSVTRRVIERMAAPADHRRATDESRIARADRPRARGPRADGLGTDERRDRRRAS